MLFAASFYIVVTLSTTSVAALVTKVMSTGDEADNTGRQDEEIEALSAIYSDDFLVVNETERLFDIRIRHEENCWWSMTLQVLLPRNYPSTVPPVFEIHATWLNDSDEFEIRDKLYSIYRENKDELVVFQWVEQIREFMNEKSVEYAESEARREAHHGDEISKEIFENQTNDIAKDPIATECLHHTTVDNMEHSLISSNTDTVLPEILHGEPITDRKSTFQAHLAKAFSEHQMEIALKELKSNRKIANATHNIVAYRIMKKDSQVILQDFDDDGEHNAGSRLLHLLQILNVQNYVVVVSRWFGGILLGPDRFKHINNCARNLLKKADVIQDHSTKHSHSKESKNKYRMKNKC